MISNACKYGVRAIVFVASKYQLNNRYGTVEIAKEIDAPEAFCAKILQTLSKNGLISSAKGPTGGFYITQDQLDKPVLDIVKAIDGMEIFVECGLGLKQCSEIHPCPMHYQYKEARQSLLTTFQTTSIGDLAETVTSGDSFLRITNDHNCN